MSFFSGAIIWELPESPIFALLLDLIVEEGKSWGVDYSSVITPGGQDWFTELHLRAQSARAEDRICIQEIRSAAMPPERI